VLSGLRAYDEEQIQQLVNGYDAQKSAATA